MDFFCDSADDSDRTRDPECVRTFLPELDDVDGSKFFELTTEGAVIEICGPSGTGKTLFCFQLCVNMSIPIELAGPGGEIVYIETDRKFYQHRLIDVFKGSVQYLRCKEWKFHDMFYHYIAKTSEELIKVVSHIKVLLNDVRTNIRLIVIDSLSTVFRDLMEDFGKMVREANKLMANLNELAKTFNLLVVITSQTTKKSLVSESHSHQVDRRLIFEKCRGDYTIGFIDKFHAHHPKTFKFSLCKEGIRSC